MTVPEEFAGIAIYAQRALGAIRPADENTKARKNFRLSAVKSTGRVELPPHYLIYFMLVEMLGFKDLGPSEKVAWSIPVDYNGKAFLIEFRKFGVGIFVQDSDEDGEAAEQIASHLQSAVRAARRYFDWKATTAANGSELNVINKSNSLFFNYQFLNDSYNNKAGEDKEPMSVAISGDSTDGASVVADLMEALGKDFLGFGEGAEARALGIAAIEAFFSWSEHAFIHIAILNGRITTGQEVANMAKAEWSEKFKMALDVTDTAIKKSFDQLMNMRKEVRNYVAHGSFGKDGEAFSFHSIAGAVPLLLPHKDGNKLFTMGAGRALNIKLALKSIEEFVAVLWSGPRLPAKIYVESELPSILTFAINGQYASAMASAENMEALVDRLAYEVDRAANMDW